MPTETIKATELKPGDNVQLYGYIRTVATVEPLADGTAHVRFTGEPVFTLETAKRWTAPRVEYEVANGDGVEVLAAPRLCGTCDERDAEYVTTLHPDLRDRSSDFVCEPCADYQHWGTFGIDDWLAEVERQREGAAA